MADGDQPKAGIPWLLVGGVAFAAWWWERKFGKKGVLAAITDSVLDPDGDEDEAVEEEVSAVEWTDEPIKKKRGRRALSDVGGPITDVYVQPIKLAANGDCEEAVSLLDRQSRQGDSVVGTKKQVVRRALRRSASIVTERCPKEVEELLGVTEDLREEIERDAGIQLPSTGRRFVPTREDFMVPGPKGARSFDPREGLPVHRTRGEAGRFKRKSGSRELEYRRKGSDAWRVLDLHSGAVTEKNVPTGKPRGRPKKLQ